jgi:hypothetical protein
MNHKREVTSYTERYYTIVKWNNELVGYEEIEILDSELSEVSAVHYMYSKYGFGKEYKVRQVFITKLYYDIE